MEMSFTTLFSHTSHQGQPELTFIPFIDLENMCGCITVKLVVFILVMPGGSFTATGLYFCFHSDAYFQLSMQTVGFPAIFFLCVVSDVFTGSMVRLH